MLFMKSKTAWRVGLFFFLGIVLTLGSTVLVNDRPFWWRPCQYVTIQVVDATGLKMRSPIRSLGIQIGYLRDIELSEEAVRLGICITATVEILPETKAYIRGEGFLGDKFVELKPVRNAQPREDAAANETGSRRPLKVKSVPLAWVERVFGLLVGHQAFAQTSPEPALVPVPSKKSPSGTNRTKSSSGGSRSIPVGTQEQDLQQVMGQVNSLVNDVSSLTKSLNDALRPEDFQRTMQELNRVLEGASKALSPQGSLTTTAQRSLIKLEDAIEQLRDQLTRVNQGRGSAGRLLNDDAFADKIDEILTKMNRLLGRADSLRTEVELQGFSMPSVGGTRASFNFMIWPSDHRYYRVGLAVDPRGRVFTTSIRETVGGELTDTPVTWVEQGGFVFSAMLGKVFWNRLDVSLGVLHSDGAFSVEAYLGPEDHLRLVTVRNDLYSRFYGGLNSKFDNRIYVTVNPLASLVLSAGMDGFRRDFTNGEWPWFVGAGLRFDDEDIKLLFSFIR